MPTAIWQLFAVVFLVQFSGAWIWPANSDIALDLDTAKPLGVLFNNIVYGVLVVALVLHGSRHGAERLLSTLRPFSPLIVWAAVCCLLGIQVGASIRALVLWLITLLAGAVIGAELRRADLARCLLLYAAAVCCASVLWALAAPNFGTDHGYWRGLFIQKNLAGWFAALSLIAALSLASPTNKFVPAVIAVFGTALLIFSGSRTSQMVMIGAAAYLYVLRLQHRTSGTRIASLLLLVIACVLIPIYGLEALLDALGKDATLSGRTIIWRLYLDKALEHPFLGFGPGTFTSQSEVTQAFVDGLREYGDIHHPHNVFIAYVGETGFVGAILLVALILKFAVFLPAADTSPSLRLPALIAFAMGVEGMAESLVGYPTNLAWFLLAACYGTYRAERLLTDPGSVTRRAKGRPATTNRGPTGSDPLALSERAADSVRRHHPRHRT